MGSDTSPQILFEAVQRASQHLEPSVSFLVLATPDIISQLPPHGNRIEYHSVSQIISMSDDPLTSIRHKKDSSLVAGLRLLKKNHMAALVSAGNTGALITGASLLLPMLPGIQRSALLALLPTENGSTAILDVGGNVYCKSHHLVQFAKMGAAVWRCFQGVSMPKVGLLNIGSESKKGTAELRQAYQILEQNAHPHFRFIGNVEARDVLCGKVDVLVTDGFTGNVLLKSIEGVAAYIMESVWKACESEATDSIKNSLRALQKHFKSDEYPGAIVCGIDRIIVKCHGNSSPLAFYHGISEAVSLVEKKLLNQIKDQII
jgi:phosphate acyltransferase